MKTRYESVAGVRNLYIDHGRANAPFVLRWKVNGKTEEEVLGVMKLKDAITKRDLHFATPVEDRERGAPIKCNEAFDKWIAAGVKSRGTGKMSKATIKLYRGIWQNHVSTALGRVRVRDVTVDHIIAVLDAIEAKGRTTNNPYVMLSSFFNAMTMEPYRYRSTNPVGRLGTKKPVAPDSEAVSEDAVMTRDEVEQIIASLPSRTAIDKRVRADLIRLAYLTGMRLSEILGLVWESVDLAAGEIDVNRQLEVDFVAGDPETWFSTVKGKKTRLYSTARIVPLDDEAIALLREYRQWAIEHSLSVFPGAFVFPTKKGTPLGQNGVSEAFTKAVAASKLTRYPWTFHCLRHSFASIEFQLGESIEGVARLLGNHPEVARKRYVHLVKRDAYNEAFRARRRGLVAVQ